MDMGGVPVELHLVDSEVLPTELEGSEDESGEIQFSGVPNDRGSSDEMPAVDLEDVDFTTRRHMSSPTSYEMIGVFKGGQGGKEDVACRHEAAGQEPWSCLTVCKPPRPIRFWA